MSKRPIDPNDLPYCLDAEDIAQLLGVSRSLAYTLMHSKDFPVITINDRRMVTPSKQFLEWIDKNMK